MSVLCPDGTEKWEAAHSSQRLPSCAAYSFALFPPLFACSSCAPERNFPKILFSMATVHFIQLYSAGIFCLEIYLFWLS